MNGDKSEIRLRGGDMKEKYIGKIVFEGRKSFNSLDEARVFKEKLGDRYLRTIKYVYPDVTFYIVEYDTPGGHLEK